MPRIENRNRRWIAAAALTFALAAAGNAAAQGASQADDGRAPTPMPPDMPARNAPGAKDADPAKPRLQGLWMFDAKASDDPAKMFAGRGGGEGGGMRGGGGRHGGMGGGGMGGGAGMGEGGPPPDAPQGGAGPEGGDAAESGRGGRRMGPAQKLVIDQFDDHIEIGEDARPPRVLLLGDAAADAKPVQAKPEGVPQGDGQRPRTPPPVHAQWHGRTLVAARTMGQRGTLTESYELSNDGKTLTITSTFSGGKRDMPGLKRVYRLYSGD